MRILFVHKHDQLFGGADTYVLRLGPLLEEAGHEVRYLTTSLDEPRFKGETLRASTSHATRDGAAGREALGIAAQALWNPKAASAAKRLVEDFRPDVAHLHKIYPQISVSAVVTLDRLGVPLVQSTYDYEFISANPHDPRGGRRDRIETRARYRHLNALTGLIRRRVHAPRIDEWLTVSDFVSERLRDHGIQARPSPMRVIEDPDRPIKPDEDRAGAIFVGRMVEEKGVPDLLTAAQRRPDLELTMVGAGPLAERVEEAASRLPNLSYVPHVPNDVLADMLQEAAVCLIPSRWEEPLGLIVFESMAAGTPMVVYDVGGLGPEAARTGSADVIEPSVDGLIDAWDGLLEDPERRERYRTAGLEYLRREGSPEALVELLIETYAKAISRS